MDFILENYIIIILVGLFFVFALIGYLIDMFRKNKIEPKEEIPVNIKPVELKDLNIKEDIKIVNDELNSVDINISDEDDLLKNYDESINE